MTWWMWLAGGLALMVLELVTPSGFFIMFFGLGAMTIGALPARASSPRAGRSGCSSRCARSAICCCSAARSRTLPGAATPDVDSLVGVLAVPQGAIAPGAVGRVEVRGSTWSARNVGAEGHLHRSALRGRASTACCSPSVPSNLSPPRSPTHVRRRLVRHRPARDPRPHRAREDRHRRAPAERLRRRAPRALLRHARRRLPHPGAVRRRDPLPALAQGNGRSTSPRRSASRATTCRSAWTACST